MNKFFQGSHYITNMPRTKRYARSGEDRRPDKKKKRLAPPSTIDDARPSTRPALLTPATTRPPMPNVMDANEQAVEAQRKINHNLLEIFIADQKHDIRQAELRIAALRKLAPPLACEIEAETDVTALRLMYPVHRALYNRAASLCY